MKVTATNHEIPTDVRQVIVRQPGAALAEAWRNQHGQKSERPGQRAPESTRVSRRLSGHSSSTIGGWTLQSVR